VIRLARVLRLLKVTYRSPSFQLLLRTLKDAMFALFLLLVCECMMGRWSGRTRAAPLACPCMCTHVSACVCVWRDRAVHPDRHTCGRVRACGATGLSILTVTRVGVCVRVARQGCPF
jgi:hypothetical protein